MGYSWPVMLHMDLLNYHQVDRRSTSQEAHGYGNELHSHVPPAQNPVPISYQVSTQELQTQQQQQEKQQPQALFQPLHHQFTYSGQLPVDHYPVTGIYNNPPHPTQGHAYYAAGDVVWHEHPSQCPTQPQCDVEPLDLSYMTIEDPNINHITNIAHLPDLPMLTTTSVLVTDPPSTLASSGHNPSLKIPRHYGICS